MFLFFGSYKYIFSNKHGQSKLNADLSRVHIFAKISGISLLQTEEGIFSKKKFRAIKQKYMDRELDESRS